MTEEKLNKANELKTNINRYEFVLNEQLDGVGCYGEYNNHIIPVEEYMIEKFKDIIREHLEELKKEFEEL